MRLVIYGNQVTEPSFKELHVLMLSGKLEPTGLKCLGAMSRTICMVCVEGSSCPRLMPPNICFIRQIISSSHLFLSRQPFNCDLASCVVFLRGESCSCWLHTWFRELVTKLAFWWYSSVRFFNGILPVRGTLLLGSEPDGRSPAFMLVNSPASRAQQELRTRALGSARPCWDQILVLSS